MLKLTTIFTIRIVYKSGYYHDFEVTEFAVKNGNSYSWKSANEKNKPIQLGADDIAAVYQIGVKNCLKWS